MRKEPLRDTIVDGELVIDVDPRTMTVSKIRRIIGMLLLKCYIIHRKLCVFSLLTVLWSMHTM